MNANGHFHDLISNLLLQRYIVVRGGAGSGKSVSVAQRVLLSCWQVPGIRWLVLRKYDTLTAGSTYQTILDQISASDFLRAAKVAGDIVVHKSPMEVLFKNGSSIMFRGMDNPDKVKSIAGITAVWMEEADQFSIHDFMQLDLRLRGASPIPHHIVLSFNPVSTASWLYPTFYSAPPGHIAHNIYHSFSTYLNNVFIDDQYKAVLNGYKELNLNYYNVYCLGEWGAADGTIYKPWPLTEPPLVPPDTTFFGVDWGYNNPSALVRVDVIDRVFYVTELVYERKLDPDVFYQRIADAVADCRSALVYCDPARPDAIDTLRRKYKVNAARAKNQVKEGITHLQMQDIRSRLGNKNINDEILLYKWKEVNGTYIDEPVKEHDHALDAVRYAIYTHDIERLGKGVGRGGAASAKKMRQKLKEAARLPRR